MSANHTMLLIGAVWLAVVAGGFVHAEMATATGSGFGHGFNVLFIFAAWEAGAIAIGGGAFLFWLIRRQELSTAVRVAGMIPPVLSFAALALVATWLAMA